MHRDTSSGSRRGVGVAAVAGVAAVIVVAVLWFGFFDDRGEPPDSPPAEGTGSVTAASGTPSTLAAPPTGTTAGPSPEPADGTSPATTSTSSTSTTTTTLPPRTCEAVFPNPDASSQPRLVDLAGDDPARVAIAISERRHTCVDDVVVAHPFDLYSATITAQLAARFSSSLLYYLPSSEAALTAELRRLAPRRIWLMEGIPASVQPPDAEIIRMPRGSKDLIEWIRSHDPSVVTGLSPVSGYRSLHSLVITGERLGITLAPLHQPTNGSSEESALLMGSAARDRGSPRLWLVDPDRPAIGLAVAAAVSALGETALYWNPEETVGWAEASDALEKQAEGVVEIWAVGEFSDSGRWLLETTLWGTELPGGGLFMFPDRRLVAFYGATHTEVLGVLGEQDPAETLERLAPYLEEYAADEVMTIPTFEMIATLATARAGRDGDYSGEISVDTMKPWVEFAAQNGVYVVLDLQPGRTDFLTQAKYYEELLALPHVGLALDPEWRLGPNQVHLRQIGSVDSAEINMVIEWLSGLVRKERLPQKLLMVHQFRFSMIRDRELVSTPPELAVLIHMDGQGPLATKYETWEALVAGAEDQGWHWGWKNFFDEDSPLATPGEVLELTPLPVYVSYQ